LSFLAIAYFQKATLKEFILYFYKIFKRGVQSFAFT
jgi:hypothetical protein